MYVRFMWVSVSIAVCTVERSALDEEWQRFVHPCCFSSAVIHSALVSAAPTSICISFCVSEVCLSPSLCLCLGLRLVFPNTRP